MNDPIIFLRTWQVISLVLLLVCWIAVEKRNYPVAVCAALLLLQLAIAVFSIEAAWIVRDEIRKQFAQQPSMRL